MNKKVRRLATKSAFPSKATDNEIVILNQIVVDKYKTKVIVSMLRAFGVEKRALIVLPEKSKKVIASAANLQSVKTATVNTLNVYDILNADKFVVLRDAVAEIEEVYA